MENKLEVSMLVYERLSVEIHFLIELQWKITNYVILLYVALFSSLSLSVEKLAYNHMVILAIYSTSVIILMISGLWILHNTTSDIISSRKRLYNCERYLSEYYPDIDTSMQLTLKDKISMKISLVFYFIYIIGGLLAIILGGLLVYGI